MKEKKNRINIYIDLKDKKKLDEIKYKYHLSYSTIANIIAEKYDLILSKELSECFLYPIDRKHKTSIKPRNDKKYLKNTFVYTNAIKIFCNNDLEKYIPSKTKRDKINNFIYAEFQNTYEENWDGNRFQRMMPRLLKQNRNYYKKILDNE